MATTQRSAERLTTREQILDIAEELLQESGFNSFSYGHIASRLGIRNAAVHYYFPSKSDLGVALLARYRDRLAEWRRAVERRSAAPENHLDGYLAIAVSHLRNRLRVCPLGVLEAEFNAIPTAMRDEVRALDSETRAWLQEILSHGRAAKAFYFAGPAEDKALVIVAALQGALQIARAAGPKSFFGTVRQIKRELGVGG